MPTCQIRFRSSVAASCLHIAACRSAGLPAADGQLAAATAEPVDAVLRELESVGWPEGQALPLLASLACEFPTYRELLQRCDARLRGVGQQDDLSRLAAALAALELAVKAVDPRLAAELPLRERPLREQWEARGPGLLLYVAKQTEPQFVAESAEAVLVAPYVGGHGLAHAATNRVTFEAVLANPVAELPETVRLAWLAGQLNGELPRYVERLNAPANRELTVALAAVPPVLAAAEFVELASCDEATFALALESWHIPVEPQTTAAVLWQWWSTYLDSATAWPIALAALEQMLAGATGNE